MNKIPRIDQLEDLLAMAVVSSPALSMAKCPNLDNLVNVMTDGVSGGS